MYLSGIETCNITICLTWIATKNTLTLNCRVEKLRFRVKFYKQNTEEAYCVMPKPSPKCNSNNEKGNITQDVNKCETRLVISDKIDTSVNGQWTCEHGRNRDIVSVNVSVIQITGNCTV